MGKSITAKMIAVYLRKFGDIAKSEERAKKELEQKMRAEETPLSDKLLRGEDVRLETVAGCQVITCGDESSEQCILYVHGGAYTMEVTLPHVNFCSKVVGRTGCCIYIPVYPLAPRHHYDETYALMDELYGMIKDRTIAFMGDSAGGGFVFSYTQYLRDRGEKLPGKIIGISPWVDVSMSSSDYASYEPKDPMLGVPGLVLAGKAWAGGLDTKDPRVSPMYGDNKGLPPVTLFTGTDEILYPDIVLYAEKLRKDGVQTDLIIGEGMNHVYPVYPIPEAKEAMEKIVNKLNCQ